MSHPFVPGALGRRRATAPTNWKERLEALRYIPALFRLIWRTHRGYTSGIVVLRVVRSVIPVATFWVGKLILDSVIAAKAGHGSLGPIWRYLSLELLIVLTGEVLARASSLIESLLGDLFSNVMSVELMEHAARELAPYKQPRRVRFVDELPRNSRSSRIPISTIISSAHAGRPSDG